MADPLQPPMESADDPLSDAMLLSLALHLEDAAGFQHHLPNALEACQETGAKGAVKTWHVQRLQGIAR